MLILTQSQDLIVNLDNVLYISVGKGSHTINAFLKTVDKPVDARNVMVCLGMYNSHQECKDELSSILLDYELGMRVHYMSNKKDKTEENQ